MTDRTSHEIYRSEGRVDDRPTSLSTLDGVLHDDQAAWERLTVLYGPVVFRKCRRAGFNEADSEDITQEVFVKLNKGLKTFQREAPHKLFRKWLSTLVKNACIDAHRRRQHQPNCIPVNFELLASELKHQCEEETAFTLKDNDLLVSFRESLKKIEANTRPEHWRAFCRTELDGLTAREVAEELALTEANVRQIRRRVFQLIIAETRMQGLIEDESGVD